METARHKLRKSFDEVQDSPEGDLFEK